jgi:hypothetical protein
MMAFRANAQPAVRHKLRPRVILGYSSTLNQASEHEEVSFGLERQPLRLGPDTSAGKELSKGKGAVYRRRLKRAISA